MFHGWRSWIDLGAATLLIFGGLAYRLHRNLKQPKRLLVFAALIVVHYAAFVHLLHSGIRIRTARYVPVVFIEGFLFGLILAGPGGTHREENDREDARNSWR